MSPGNPPVTTEEVLAVFRDWFRTGNYVVTALRVAKSAWWSRGGIGPYDDRPRNGYPLAPNVPFVRASDVQPALDALVTAGVLVTSVGHHAKNLGTAWEPIVPDWQYYGLTDIRVGRREETEPLRGESRSRITRPTSDDTAKAVAALSTALVGVHVDVVPHLDVVGHGEAVVVVLSVAQARDLATVLASK